MKANCEQLTKIKKALTGYRNLSPLDKAPYFGKAPCQLCGSVLAGDRYEFTALLGKRHDIEVVKLDCCFDCFGYLFT